MTSACQPGCREQAGWGHEGTERPRSLGPDHPVAVDKEAVHRKLKAMRPLNCQLHGLPWQGTLCSLGYLRGDMGPLHMLVLLSAMPLLSSLAWLTSTLFQETSWAPGLGEVPLFWVPQTSEPPEHPITRTELGLWERLLSHR